MVQIKFWEGDYHARKRKGKFSFNYDHLPMNVHSFIHLPYVGMES